MRPFHKAVPVMLVLGALAPGSIAAQADPSPPKPQVRLFAPSDHVVLTVHHSDGERWVDFNPAVYLQARGARLEVDVRRRSANAPITAKVRVGDRTRTVPKRLLAGWTGLRGAFVLTWRKPSGTVIARRRLPWCPNEGTQSRLGPHSATTTAFIEGCSTHPFTRSQRWGIDRGWARPVPTSDGNPPVGRLGDHAVLEISMRKALARSLGIAASDRTLRLDVDVRHVTDADRPADRSRVSEPRSAATVRSAASSSRARAPHAPLARRSGRIPASALPDLVALPAFGIATHHEAGRDLLDFSATVYNGGRGPLVTEGFRRGGDAVMDAYQFFYRGTTVVGSARVGTMEYDVRPSHEHWHFEDFAVYDLVDGARQRLRTSGKEAFCLAPTDSIDMLQRGAAIDPGNGDLATACGDASSIWVREVLASGWGDTYSQDRAGQSIEVTGLPNGTYWIRVAANPSNRLHERSHANNVSLRRVILGGTPGHRTVRIPRYGRIDSEVGAAPGERAG